MSHLQWRIPPTACGGPLRLLLLQSLGDVFASTSQFSRATVSAAQPANNMSMDQEQDINARAVDTFEREISPGAESFPAFDASAKSTNGSRTKVRFGRGGRTRKGKKYESPGAAHRSTAAPVAAVQGTALAVGSAQDQQYDVHQTQGPSHTNVSAGTTPDIFVPPAPEMEPEQSRVVSQPNYNHGDRPMFGAAPPAAVTTTYSSSNTGTLRSSTRTGTTSTTGSSTFASTTSSTRNTAWDIASLLSLHKTLGARLHHSPSDRVLPLQREALNLELALAFRNNVAGRSGGAGGGRGSGGAHEPTQEDETRFSPTGPLRNIKTGGAIIRPGAASHQADADEEDFDVDNFHSVLKRTLPKPLECDWSTEMGRAAAREVLQIKSLGEKEGGRSLKHSPQYQNLDKRFLLDKLLLEGDSAKRSSWVAESISSESGPQTMRQLPRAPVPIVSSSAPPFLPQQQSTQHHSGPPPVVAAAPAVPFYAEMPTSVGGSAYPYQFVQGHPYHAACSLCHNQIWICDPATLTWSASRPACTSATIALAEQLAAAESTPAAARQESLSAPPRHRANPYGGADVDSLLATYYNNLSLLTWRYQELLGQGTEAANEKQWNELRADVCKSSQELEEHLSRDEFLHLRSMIGTSWRAMFPTVECGESATTDGEPPAVSSSSRPRTPEEDEDPVVAGPSSLGGEPAPAPVTPGRAFPRAPGATRALTSGGGPGPVAFIDGGDSRWIPATNMEPRQVLTGLQRPLVPLAAVEGDEGDRGDEDGKYDTLVHEYFHVPSGAAGGGLKMSTIKSKSSSAWPGGKARPGDGSLQRGSEASLSLQSLLSKRSTSAGSVLLGKIEENDESSRDEGSDSYSSGAEGYNDLPMSQRHEMMKLKTTSIQRTGRGREDEIVSRAWRPPTEKFITRAPWTAKHSGKREKLLDDRDYVVEILDGDPSETGSASASGSAASPDVAFPAQSKTPTADEPTRAELLLREQPPAYQEVEVKDRSTRGSEPCEDGEVGGRSLGPGGKAECAGAPPMEDRIKVVKPKDNSCKNKKNRFNRKNLHSATVDTPAAARPVDRIGSGGSAAIPRNGPFLKFHAGP